MPTMADKRVKKLEARIEELEAKLAKAVQPVERESDIKALRKDIKKLSERYNVKLQFRAVELGDSSHISPAAKCRCICFA